MENSKANYNVLLDVDFDEGVNLLLSSSPTCQQKIHSTFAGCYIFVDNLQPRHYPAMDPAVHPSVRFMELKNSWQMF